MSIGQKFDGAHVHPGFDWLRLALAVGIFTFHSTTITYGSADAIPPLLRAVARLLLPMFFALSGFLVTASLWRSQSVTLFLSLRVFRLVPALLAIVLMSTFVLGPLVTESSWQTYFSSNTLSQYLANALAQPHYQLPGVFLHNPRSGVVNGSLWTIPLELWCYTGLAIISLVGLTKHRHVLAILCLVSFAGIALADYAQYDLLAHLPTGDLALPFLAGIIVFAAATVLPLHGPLAIISLCAAMLLSMQPQGFALAMLPLAYFVVWLGLQPLPSLPGDYSYGLYLVGYPIEQTYVAFFPGTAWWQSWAACLPLALVCAVLLWHMVEKPALSRRKFAARAIARIWLPSVAGNPPKPNPAQFNRA
ncbi:MAG: acyltransferase family protein [Subtercola sp.]|nr:acyltransferase family protein [Subtercola sp.]